MTAPAMPTSGRDAAAAEEVVEGPDILRAVFRHEERHGDLREFGGLQRHDQTRQPDLDPAVRTVDFGKAEGGDEEQQEDAAHQEETPRRELAVADDESRRPTQGRPWRPR